MKGLIFDLDGTLWDSTEDVARAWNIALDEKTDINRRITADDLRSVFGKPLKDIFYNLFPDIEEEKIMEVSQVLYSYQHDTLEEATCGTYEGVIEGIKELSKKYPLFIVSNCQAGYIEVFLRYTKLGEYIKDHTCPGDTGEFKAYNIKLIMERNKIEQVIYVGDTAGDKEACDEVGVPMIHASYGFGKVENPAAIITKFEELLTMDLESLIK